MNRICVIGLVGLLVSALFFATAAAADRSFALALDLIEENSPEVLLKAKALYEKRDGSARNARQMLTLVEPYLKDNPDDYSANLLAAMACFWISDRTEDEKVKKEYGLKGVGYAEKTMALKPDNSAGFYYYTINMGEYGKGISIPTALFKGLDKKFRAQATKAIELDPTFEGGGAYRALGRFYHKLPWPKYSAEKSEQNLLKAIEIAPQKVRSYFYLAETFIQEKEYDKADKVIDDGLATQPYDWDAWEDGFYRGELERLKKKITAEKK